LSGSAHRPPRHRTCHGGRPVAGLGARAGQGAGGKLGVFGALPASTGSAAPAAADGPIVTTPIVTTLLFVGALAAADFCSGLSARAAAGRARGTGGCGWYGSTRLISPGGRGGAVPSAAKVPGL